MNGLELFGRALEHLVRVSALIQPKAEPGSAVKLETAFMWNYSNNVAVLGADFRTLIDAGSFIGPVLVARTMMESALILSAGATKRIVMREKIDFDLRQNIYRLEKAEKELGADLTMEIQTLSEHLKSVREGSTHNQKATLDFLQIAKRANFDSTPAYRNYYFVLSFHVHADWLAFMQTAASPSIPDKAVSAAIFACAVAVESLQDFYPDIKNQSDLSENREIWKALAEPHKAPKG